VLMRENSVSGSIFMHEKRFALSLTHYLLHVCEIYLPQFCHSQSESFTLFQRC
jgi:hypothetical protein